MISSSNSTSEKVTYLNQDIAQKVDEDLMNFYGFSMNCLMELAGQSVAHSIHYLNKKYHENKINNILIIVGPGNNGGDGIVAARHICMFGLKPTILFVKKPNKDFFINLVKSCQFNYIEILNYDDLTIKLKSEQKSFQDYIQNGFQLVVDAIFGFSFKPPIRAPFDEILTTLGQIKNIPIYSIDIPSGWDVDNGNTQNTFIPNYLISLTLPKLCTKEFKGKHFLGGRFIPKHMIEKNNWIMPKYDDLNQFLEL